MLLKEELLHITGGAISWGTVGIVFAGIISFLAGFLEGFTNPKTCSR